MRIANIGYALAEASGVTTFVVNVARELCALGHEVEVFDAVDRAALVRFDARNFDVIHIHGLWRFHAFAKAARKAGVPIVWSTHGMTAPWSLKHKWWKKAPFWYLQQLPDLKKAAAVHCTVEQEQAWNEALCVKRCFVAPLGTALPTPGEEASEQLPSSGRTLLFVGRVYPVKAIDRLIMAFAKVPHDGWRLRIVGPDEDGHLAELQKLDCRDVDFVGPKYGADLAWEYANCACAALVSHTENFGATIVDGLSHGKPVIAGTKTPWKIVADRGCGWWVDNEVDALAVTLRKMMSLSDAERAEMGRKGRQLVAENYTWRAVAETMASVYGKIVNLI